MRGALGENNADISLARRKEYEEDCGAGFGGNLGVDARGTSRAIGFQPLESLLGSG